VAPHGARFTHTYASGRAPEDKFTATLYERQQADVSTEAAALQRFVAENFVIAHIDAQYAPNGQAVLKQTGADYPSGLPFIFTVDAQGRRAAELDHDLVETRRDTDDWYHGYHRGERHSILTVLGKLCRETNSKACPCPRSAQKRRP